MKTLMVQHFKLIIIVFTILPILAGWKWSNTKTDVIEFFVSPDGKDNSPGTKERPFLTIEAARDAARVSKDKGEIKIVLRGGNYFVSKTLEFNQKDSGTPDHPYTLTSHPGERARLIGGVPVSSNAVKKTIDEAILNRIISHAAREYIYEIDLKTQGITNYGKIRPRGFGRAVQPNTLELTINGKRLRMAQWPNEDDVDKNGRGAGSDAKDIHYIKMPNPIDKGSIPRKEDFSNKGGLIPYDYSRPDKYQSSDIYIAGFLNNGYAYDMIPIESIDRKKKHIKLTEAHMYGLGSHKKWGGRGFTEYFFLNVLEEIDQPGESFLDRQSGKIYFMLPEGIVNDGNLEILASVMEEPILAIEEASYFHLKDLAIECGRAIGIYMEGGENNLIQGCTLRNLGTAGIMLGKGVDASPKTVHEYTGTLKPRMMGSIMQHTYQNSTVYRNAGKNHTISNCEIHDIGVVGVYLGGGNRETLEAGNNVVSNCRIYRTQNVERFFYGAVCMDGVGNRVEHSEIFDLFDAAIWSWGNDMEIKYNKIHNCLKTASDKGVIYTGRNPSAFNLQIENNFIYDNGNPYGYTAVVHMDDYACGLVFKNNICYRNDRIFFINSGFLHTIENNIFVNNYAWDDHPVDYEHGIRKGSTPEEWLKVISQSGQNSGIIYKRIFEEVDVRNPPYSARYPRLVEIVINPQKSFGSTLVRKNVCINSGILISNRPLENPGADSEKSVYNNWVEENIDLKRLNLGFNDIDKMDLSTSPNSEIFKKVSGFEMIDFGKIGIQSK